MPETPTETAKPDNAERADEMSSPRGYYYDDAFGYEAFVDDEENAGDDLVTSPEAFEKTIANGESKA